MSHNSTSHGNGHHSAHPMHTVSGAALRFATSPLVSEENSAFCAYTAAVKEGALTRIHAFEALFKAVEDDVIMSFDVDLADGMVYLNTLDGEWSLALELDEAINLLPEPTHEPYRHRPANDIYAISGAAMNFAVSYPFSQDNRAFAAYVWALESRRNTDIAHFELLFEMIEQRVIKGLNVDLETNRASIQTIHGQWSKPLDLGQAIELVSIAS